MTTFRLSVTIYLDAHDREGADAEAEFLLDTIIDHGASIVAVESERPVESSIPEPE